MCELFGLYELILDRKLPFQEKHVTQQASILGNLEEFGVLESSVCRGSCEFMELAENRNGVPVVVDFVCSLSLSLSVV